MFNGQIADTGVTAANTALAIAMKEREHCLSDREWRHRLRGYGYELRQTPEGPVLALLATGVALCPVGAL